MSQKVLLGFEDEIITEKYKNQVNFATNKIGGKPDLPNNVKLEPPICPLCQLARPLVLQIYAPLENSQFHRILYLFACINPNCWNQNESWVCLRVQHQEKIPEEQSPVSSSVTEWCTDADDWDDDNNLNEENGNIISEKVSDEDDESCSFDESLRNLTIDERNANAFGGAVGHLRSPCATAEIEGPEGEIITIDSPTMPQYDLPSLLHDSTPLPPELRHGDAILQFQAAFVSVYEESLNGVLDQHVKELLQEYQQRHELPGESDGDGAHEKYEKNEPAHGDRMFHHFLTRIQANPGQIVRYCRNNTAVLLVGPHGSPGNCSYCKGELVFEFQVLPTIISKLRLIGDARQFSRLEFGTVLVFTCKNSCWGDSSVFQYETVLVQSEVY